jgi:hypothetical protein
MNTNLGIYTTHTDAAGIILHINRMCRNLNMGSTTTGATSDAEIAYIFRAPEFVPVFSKGFLVHFVQ